MLKRFLFSLMVLILFGSGGDIIRLLAHCVDYNRGYNRMHEFKSPSTNTDYAQCQGNDEDGSMSAYASSSADKEEILENIGNLILWRRGVDYTASAGCSSWVSGIENGYFSVEAYVPNKTVDVYAGFFDGFLIVSAYRNSFTEMGSVDAVDIFSELASCNAGASVSGEGNSGNSQPTYQYATAVGNW